MQVQVGEEERGDATLSEISHHVWLMLDWGKLLKPTTNISHQSLSPPTKPHSGGTLAHSSITTHEHSSTTVGPTLCSTPKAMRNIHSDLSHNPNLDWPIFHPTWVCMVQNIYLLSTSKKIDGFYLSGHTKKKKHSKKICSHVIVTSALKFPMIFLAMKMCGPIGVYRF